VFNAKDLKENRYLNMDELQALCSKLSLPMVEILETGLEFNYNLEQLKNLSKGNYPNSKYPREGIVFRLQKDWNSGHRSSFKIINDDFLIKQDGK
jgi:ATP-dependent RNA circularization protein (DNA/RNA ligase family)